MARGCEIDRLSALPDNILICNIFSHLSLTNVVRTSLLSSRWRSLWKQIHNLHFSRGFFQTLKLSAESRPCIQNLEQKAKYINDIVDNILLLHSGHVERLSIYPCELEPMVFKALRVEQWVHHAALKQVKHFSLNYSFGGFFDAPPYVPPDVPPSLFACHLLRDLKLWHFSFTEIPPEFDGFHSLQSCYFSGTSEETNDRLQQFIGLCPLLEKLVLQCYWGLSDLKIQAPNLKSLIIAHCDDMESLTLDCPQLANLKITDCYKLSEFKIPKRYPMLNSLKKLSLKSCPRITDLTLLTIIGCFCNLEEVQISRWHLPGIDYLEQEMEKGEVTTNLTFPSLKKVYFQVSASLKEEEAVMLEFLLNHAPTLNGIFVSLPSCPANVHDKEFINKVMDLQQINEKVDIRVKIDANHVNGFCCLSM